MPEPLTRAEFAASIKAKYPVYASVPDEELVTRMLEKYPVYQAQVKTEQAAAAVDMSKDARINRALTSEGYGVPTDVAIGGVSGKTIGGLLAMAGMAGMAGPAILRGMTGPGMGMGARVYASARAAAEAATPTLKYEAAKSTMEWMGIPSSIAAPVAMVISGIKRGAKAPTAEAPAPATAAPVSRVPANATGTRWGYVPPTSVAAEVETAAAGAARGAPAASTPVAPASPVAPDVPPSVPARPVGPRWSPQRIRNEVGLAERRGGVSLTEAQRADADRLVAQGQTPGAAVQTVAGPPAATPAPTPAVASVTPGQAMAVASQLRLSAAETLAYQRLRLAGRTHEEAVQAIETMRDMASRLGTPSPEEVRRAVAERNATGRWRSPK